MAALPFPLFTGFKYQQSSSPSIHPPFLFDPPVDFLGSISSFPPPTMALRSLDNALPLTPERPRKVAKLSSTAVPTPPGVNDENMPLTDPAPEYIPSHHLNPLTDPESKLQGLMEVLESKDWVKVCEALNDVRRLVIHHSSLLQPAFLDIVLLVLTKSMKSPRSALCKSSIMASSDVFHHFGQLLLSSPSSDAFDQLLLRLLLTASQDKKFVCEEAEKALAAMATHLPALPLLGQLASYVNHANLKVRAKTAVSISSCVSNMTLEEMEEFGLRRLLRMAAELLNDRLPEAREAARGVAGSIFKAFTSKEDELPADESWKEFCSSNLPPISAQAMVKAVL